MIVQSSGKNILGQRTMLRRRMIQDLREEARELRLFAKEFGQGVRQQRVRDKKERKGWNSPAGPKNDPKSSKMKTLLTQTCSKSCKS